MDSRATLGWPLALLLASCSDGFAPSDESGGEGGSGGESSVIGSDRPISEPGPSVDDVELRVATCVFPLTVSSTADPAPGPGGCQSPPALQPGTLRHAIACANANPGFDTVTSAIPGNVSLSAGCGGLTINDALTWQSALNFVIGGAAGMTGDLILVNAPGATVNSSNLRLVGASGQRGIHLKSGTLSLNYPYISGMQNPAGNGAGILVLPPTGQTANLTLNKGHLGFNRSSVAGAIGGGLYFGGPGRLIIEGSLFEGNAATERGGGIAYAAASAPLTAQASITNTTVTHNITSNRSAGLSVESVASPTLVINNSTISENQLGIGSSGAGVGAEAGASVQIQHGTIADNIRSPGGAVSQVHSFGGTFYLIGSILRGASAACGGTVTNIAGPSNVWHDATCSSLSGLSSTNALLGAVLSNGGSCAGPSHPCKTQKPAPASPANNAAITCLAADQRGTPRGAAPCWAGAYEL